MKILDPKELKAQGEKYNFSDLVKFYEDGEDITVYMTDSPEDLNHIPGIDDQVNVKSLIRFLKKHGLNNLIFGVTNLGPELDEEMLVSGMYIAGITDDEIAEKLSGHIYHANAGVAEYEGSSHTFGQTFYYFERG